MQDRKLAKQVFERFGVKVPQWRETGKGKSRHGVRIYSREERMEMDKLVDWLCFDEDYLSLFSIYFNYADTLTMRSYASPEDLVCKISPDKKREWQTKVMRNFARGEVEYIYHDMCCDPATILGNGSADGYWVYLDREWIDISHMKVGRAIINTDEVWSVINGTLHDWQQRCVEREVHYLKHHCYTCDRCGKDIFNHCGCRFDVYENLLHCPECVKECSHWKQLDKRGKRK